MVFESFRRMRRERGDAPAFLIASGDRALPITWRAFTDDINVVARLLSGYATDATVGVLGENSYDWMVVHAACLFTKMTVTPLDANMTEDEIAARLKFVGARVFVYSSLYAEKARAVARRCPGLHAGGFGTRKTERYLERTRAALAKSGESIWDGPAPDPDRVSMLVFTSGTTSEPRGAELTLGSLESFLAFARAQLPLAEGSRSLMLLPLHHIFGVCTTYFMLSSGVALGVCPDFRRIYDAVERFRANFLFLVPALADILAQKIEQKAPSAEEALGQRLDWILTGGAAMPRRTYEHLTALGVKAITGYGLTETTALYSITPYSGDPHVGAQGRAADATAAVETKVSPEGELLIRGACVMKGYYREPERTAQAIDAEGWYHTGDLGRIDDEGYVWITGRASRTIILSSGKKIAPEELEEKLLSIPGIREAVVSGEGVSRDVRAEVFATIPEESTRRAVSALNQLLPVYKRIRTLVVRAEPFPRTSSGKIRLG